MSNEELIKRLREEANQWAAGNLYELAADALEAKAAPVGELEALDDWYNSRSFSGMNVKEMMCMAFQAGAAYQRAQQPQSAEAVAYTTAGMLAIAKELPRTGRIGARCKADDRWNVPLYTTPQPSAGVVVLEQCAKWCAEQAASDWHGRTASDMVREFARLNGKEVGRG